METIWNKRNYFNDIKELLRLIKKHEIKGDFSGLEQVIEEIENCSRSVINYKLVNFSIYLNKAIKGAFPEDMHLCEIYFGNQLALKDELDINTDPLYKYSLDLKISLYKSPSNKNKVYCSTWHLDKEGKKEDFSYTHPYYHFQFGGKKHEYLDPEMSVLGGPRIPHPPMDIILGFHFIINNFINNKHFKYVKEIMEEPTYATILKNSKKRLWKPYFSGFSSSNNNHQDYKITKLFPLYYL